ncbi:hypothetical protein AbraIFM66950_001589 [Aspergillus brasiliensis]|nr:hypothetical protein AbraIFM66950_001589 [Aspergillus brasiliensis]
MAVLNQVLRAYFPIGEYNELDANTNNSHQFIHRYPDSRWEIDHFFEIQHVVEIVWDKYKNEWQNFMVVELMDLSSFINDYRNLYIIPKMANQKKKGIKLQDYWLKNELIASYLNCEVKNENYRNVESLVKELARQMRDRKGDNGKLTRLVGEKLCKEMAF